MNGYNFTDRVRKVLQMARGAVITGNEVNVHIRSCVGEDSLVATGPEAEKGRFHIADFKRMLQLPVTLHAGGSTGMSLDDVIGDIAGPPGNEERKRVAEVCLGARPGDERPLLAEYVVEQHAGTAQTRGDFGLSEEKPGGLGLRLVVE